MNFAQVYVVACAVVAVVGCGNDRATDDVGSSDDDSVSDLTSVATQEVGSGPITQACTVTLTAPSTHVLGTSVHLTANATCSPGTPDIQFYHRTGTSGAWTIVQPFSAVNTLDWPTTTATAGTHQFLAKARAQGTTTPTINSSTKSVTMTHAPVANNDSAMVTEDTPANIDVVANDTDVDTDPLTLTSAGPAAHGTVAIISTHRVRYTPALDYFGPDSFHYTISDGHGGTAGADVTVWVSSVDDAPVAVDDSATVAEDSAVTIDVVANDSDVDGDALDVASVTAPAHGAVTIDDDHHVTYTPDANYNGPDSFSYTVTDSSGAPDSANVAITVTAVNDAPIANDDTTTLAEDGSASIDVVANDFDADLDTLTITAITAPAHGLALIADGHHISYTPAPDYHGPDALTYTISDGTTTASASLTIDVTSVNDAPVAVADSATTDEDTATTIDVIANDSDLDLDALTVSSVTTPGHGTAVIAGNQVTYTPAANYHGPDGFSYTVDDGAGGSATASVAISVTSINDAPVAVADSATTDEDTATTIDVIANDSDVDLDTLTVTSVTAPAHGTAVIAGNQVTYTPAADYHGPDSFDYTISDGTVTATATVTLAVTSVNDAPVAAAGAASTFDDTPVTITLSATDVEGDPISFAIAAAPAHGTAALAGNVVTYTPATGYVGADSFTFAASDGTDSGTAAVAITVIQSVCGNGVQEGVHEECDDGNSANGDGCEATCKLTCGSGTGADRATVDAASAHCFAAYDGTTVSYQAAASLCRAAGGHLPTLTSADEDAAAFDAVNPGDTPWLGGDDLAAEGTFRWTTGEPLAYSNFATGKPDNAGGADCLHYLSDGTWSDTACTGTTGVLCEFALISGTTVAPAGASTVGAVVADFNADGYADLATIAANAVTVQLGNGAGGFGALATYTTTTAPIAIASGDFNSDGNVDLAVARSGQIQLLLGSASGAFTAGTAVTTVGGATALATADIDGDGKLDLVLGISNALAVLRGNGAGGFSALPNVALAPNGTAATIATGDLDNDGDVDLVVGTQTAVLVVRNNGTTFAAPTVLATTTSNRALVVRDVTGDGNRDVVVACAAGVSVYSGAPLALIQTVASPGVKLVAAGDFDGDGGTDLVAVASDFATLLHGASGTFSVSGAPVATGGEGAVAAIAASINDDATADLVVAHASASAGVVFGGATGLAGGRALVVGTGSTATVAADFNEDGRTDLAVIDPGASQVFVFTQTVGGTLTLASTITMQTNAGSSFGLAADFDNDGHLDLAIANVNFSSISVLLGAGNGTFSGLHNTGTARAPRRFAVGDIDRDGKLDLAVATTLGNSVSILINAGGGFFGRVNDVVAGNTPAATALADFNGDGKLDLAVATLGDASVKLLLGTGGTTFNPPTAFPTASGGEGLVVADLDGDGKLDLAATCASAGSVSVLLGTGTGSFGTAASFAAGPAPAALVARDLDGDGRLDLVTGGAGSVTILHANPAGGYVASSTGVGATVTSVTVSDLDRDGHLDVAASTAGPMVTELLSPR